MVLVSGFYPMLYGFVQCSGELFANDCNQCLANLFNANRLNTCNHTIGCGVLSYMCNVGYDIRKFYNDDTRFSVPSIAASSLAPTPTATITNITPTTGSRSEGTLKNNDSITKITLSITISVGAFLILLAVCYLRCYPRKGANTSNDGENIGDIILVESGVYDLPKVRNAIGNFAESNKLGQGGFGAVYKVINYIYQLIFFRSAGFSKS